MIRGFYSAGSGLVSQQAAIDNAANNLANVSTLGYKKQKLGFSELLYSNMDSSDKALKVGNGSRASAITNDFSQGPLQFTGKELDFALESGGFFAVQAEDGSVKYSRDGSFGVSAEETGDYLVTAGGEYVLDDNGERIIVDDTDLTEKIGVYDFSNPYGLKCGGNNLYEITPESGDAIPSEGQIRSGSLELSNVDLSSEMTDLIAIQRSFQFNSQMVQTSDEIENIINNLR